VLVGLRGERARLVERPDELVGRAVPGGALEDHDGRVQVHDAAARGERHRRDGVADPARQGPGALAIGRSVEHEDVGPARARHLGPRVAFLRHGDGHRARRLRREVAEARPGEVVEDRQVAQPAHRDERDLGEAGLDLRERHHVGVPR